MRKKLLIGFGLGIVGALFGVWFAMDQSDENWLHFEITHRFSTDPETQHAQNPWSFFGWTFEQAGGDYGRQSETSKPHVWGLGSK